jgi:hypothetical protein
VALAGLLLLVSCSSGDEVTLVLGNEVTLAGDAVLVCSESCLQRGQCGQTEESWVVVLSSAGPATTDHDRTLAVDSGVTIAQNQMALVENVSGPSTPWREAFYQVATPGQEPAWVAGWCIGQEIVP